MLSVRELITCLQGLQTAGPSQGRGRKRRRRRNRRRGAPVTPGTMGSSQLAIMASQPQPQRRNRRRRAGGSRPSAGLGQGEVTLVRHEFLEDVIAGKGKSLVLAPGNFSWLKNVAKAFERYRWQFLHLEYRPAVGTTTAGTVALGVDWSDSSVTADEVGQLRLSADPSKASVLACTPNVDGPVWSAVPRLPIPPNRLQSRAWYDIPSDLSKASEIFDVAVGSLVCYASGSGTVGEIWVNYSVTLSGTRLV